MPNPDLVKQFGGKLLGLNTGAVLTKLIDIGYQVGLFEAAKEGPAASENLARRPRSWYGLGGAPCQAVLGGSWLRQCHGPRLPATTEQHLRCQALKNRSSGTRLMRSNPSPQSKCNSGPRQLSLSGELKP